MIKFAPAELPKQAASFDLPITSGCWPAADNWCRKSFATMRSSANGPRRQHAADPRALSIAIAAQQQGLRGLVVPTTSTAEAAVVEGIEVIPVSSLSEAVGFFSGELRSPTPARVDEWFRQFATYDVDFADVRGQEMAKLAITIAAAGGHNLLMIGPPGSGGTMPGPRSDTAYQPESCCCPAHLALYLGIQPGSSGFPRQ